MQVRSHRSGALAVLGLGLALAGCANVDVFDTSERWFSRPFDFKGRNAGYTFSELQDTNANRGSVAGNALVDANGACPAMNAAPASAESQGVMPAPAGSAESSSLLGGAVGLGMTECEVVYRAGAPANVQIGASPNGERSVVLTYNSGPRPGIYRFEAGRLTNMDRLEVAEPKPGPKAKKPKLAKKKPVRPEQTSTN